MQGEKAWQKDVSIMTMKAIPEFDVAIPFCQVARVNKGFNIVLKVPIVLKHIIFAIHSHSGRVIDEIVKLLFHELVTWGDSAEFVDERMPKLVPVAGYIAVQRLTYLPYGGIDILNEGVDSLRVHKSAVVSSGFKFFQEVVEFVPAT